MKQIIIMRWMDNADALERADLNLLRLLEALFATRNVTRAGDRVDLSQPAASRALARLRVMFGDPLFVRGQVGLVPTRRAEALRVPLQRVLADMRAILASPVFDPATASGAVRLVMPDIDATTLVPQLLARFARDAPGLDITLPVRRTDPLAALAADEVDLALGVFAAAPAGFHRQRLYTDTMVCLLRRGHPALARGLTLERFAALTHVLVTITGEGGGAVDAALAKRGMTRRIGLRVPSFLAAPLVVARSDLVVTLPRRLAHELVSVAPLVEVEPPLAIPSIDVSQFWHARQHADARHAWLRRTVAAVARSAA
jgi:DNA-binding transcriptional LysR family regulator